jgi:predicted transcriptional regulator
MNSEDKKKPVDVRTAARLMYETTPLTLAEVAKEVGLSARTVKRYATADGGWCKVVSSGLSRRAHEAADKVAEAVKNLPPDATQERKSEALAAAAENVAVDGRAQLLAKHRRQWGIVDGLVAEAVRSRDLNTAKLADTVCRTIGNKQAGERKAWGLEAGGGDQKIHIIIERE